MPRLAAARRVVAQHGARRQSAVADERRPATRGRHSAGCSLRSLLLPQSTRELVFVLLGIIMCAMMSMLATEAFVLPRIPKMIPLPIAVAAPVKIGAGTVGSSLVARAVDTLGMHLGMLTGNDVPPRPEGLDPHGVVENITVVMPCFGQVAWMEEGLASVVHQRYPPAEILVVDDGSEDHCGRAASKILSTTLAAPRRRQIRVLIKWWGWGAAELSRFRDEVLQTANRGVAHARNAGIWRARGNWVCCLDADDMISDTYFLLAMQHVRLHAGTNLVYAKQQFFGESKWQWMVSGRQKGDEWNQPRCHRTAPTAQRPLILTQVPDLKPDLALVNGPLPLMTLWRKQLWEGTPHGFDEALPKGHEDWAFWLQLTRLPVQSHKLDQFLTQ